MTTIGGATKGDVVAGAAGPRGDKVTDGIFAALRAQSTRDWAALSFSHRVHFHTKEEFEEFLRSPTLLGMVVLQDCNMGGEYWRYFFWFDDKREETSEGPGPPKRFLCVDKKWWMPEPFERHLVDWTERETVAACGRRFVTDRLGDNPYIWTLVPT